MNPKANGQLQREWGWLIAIYLFLGGIGGGAYTIAALNWFVGDSSGSSTRVGLWIGFPALLIGSLFLIADLGSPTRAFLAAMKPGTSWIARGTLIISGFMLLSLAHLVLFEFTAAAQTAGGRTLLNLIAVLGAAFAIMTMAYTGILLGASKGIPFWRTGAVPAVFVVSALVTGHFTILLGMLLVGAVGAEALQTMAVEAAVLVVLELLVILFFLQASFKLPDPRDSVQRILRNRMFVVGYFVLGLGVPLLLMLLLVRSGAASAGNAAALAGFGAVLGLVGGLILRQAVLVCGALPTLNIGGFEFRRIARPKDPKAGVGLLPPQ
jgi:formate-dependent nitrite reductase membrane component NrfD